MGQTDSRPKRISKEQRQQRDHLKHSTLQQRCQDIEQLQQSMVQSAQQNQVVPYKEMTTMLQIGETAKNQLNRGGGALTKTDLVAVIVALDPTLRKDLSQLHQLTLSDLNSMIRSIIYDPSRIFTKNLNLRIQ